MPRRRKHARQGQRRRGAAGTAWPVSIIFENLDAGMTVDEVMRQFDVTRERVRAVLEFVAPSLTKARQNTRIDSVECWFPSTRARRRGQP